MIIGSQIGVNPCGFCGRSGTCTIGLKKTARAVTPVSDCPYFVKFSLKPAGKTKKSGPSTNRPIICVICKARSPKSRNAVDEKHVYWSYNIPAHIEATHNAEELSREFTNEYAITEEELANLHLQTNTSNRKRKIALEATANGSNLSKRKKIH